MSEPENETDKTDDVLRRMLNTPPKPHEFGETKKDGGKPKPAAEESKDAE